jgi:inosine-uridine nucleoside N-ribohydrolase
MLPRSLPSPPVISIAFDMETSDPDDALTLCLLATHPRVDLRAVTVNPGTRAQLGVVRRLLGELGSDVPVGARAPAFEDERVSEFHRTWLGLTAPADPDGPAAEVLRAALQSESRTVLLCGAPLHNVRDLMRHEVHVERLVAQGGFAGDNLVPPERRLAKFEGRILSESHNLGGNKKASLAVLGDPRLAVKQLVSKNVTHGVMWDAEFQRSLPDDVAPGVALMREAMTIYLELVPEGKALHDPLAACAAIDPAVIEWAEVQVLYEAGRWGAEAAEGTGTFISIGVDRDRFRATLLA